MAEMELNEFQNKVLHDYLDNNMKKLKQLVNKTLLKVGFISETDSKYDNFLSVANIELFNAVVTYNPDRNVPIDAYIANIVSNKVKEEKTRQMRQKRQLYQRDKDGKILRDSYDKPIVIHNVSIDDLTEDGCDVKEVIPAKEDVESIIFGHGECEFDLSEKMISYLNRISDTQRKLLLMLSNDIPKDMIKDRLHLSEKGFQKEIQNARRYDYISILF